MRLKNIYSISLILIGAAAFFSGCGDDDDEPGVASPDWQFSLEGSSEAPGWTANNDASLYQGSMTAVIQLPETLQPFVADADEMAAFVGTDCRSVGVMHEVNEQQLFFFALPCNNADASNVTLRYYSEDLKMTFECEDVFTLVQNDSFGKAGKPEIVAFGDSLMGTMTAYTYPLYMTAYLNLSNSQYTEGDKLAAFINDECRGVGEMVQTTENGSVYKIDIRSKRDDDENVIIRFFDARREQIFESTDTIKFVAKSVLGSQAEANIINF